MSLAELDAMLEMKAENPPPQGGPLALRDWFEVAHATLPIPGRLNIQRVDAGPVGGDLIQPEGAMSGGLIIYYHGGGFVLGSSKSHRTVAANLARVANVAVLAADYRLAPEHTFPAAHDDALAVYQWALANEYEAIALAGDSAGGNLALSTAVRVRDAECRSPVALALMSPALDFAADGASHHCITDDPILSKNLISLFLSAYLPGYDLRDPAISPLFADLSNLPPVLVHVGSREMLRDDSVNIVQKLRDAGNQADLRIWDGMCHSWQLYAALVQEGMDSIEESARFLRTRLLMS
jgi:acetyl esterase/lipase